MHLGPPVLDKVERSWSCWRHPNASGVGVNVACAMGNTRFSQAPGDFLEGGCGRVCKRGERMHTVQYDDGDVEEHDLSEGGGERWVWLPGGR